MASNAYGNPRVWHAQFTYPTRRSCYQCQHHHHDSGDVDTCGPTRASKAATAAAAVGPESDMIMLGSVALDPSYHDLSAKDIENDFRSLAEQLRMDGELCRVDTLKFTGVLHVTKVPARPVSECGFELDGGVLLEPCALTNWACLCQVELKRSHDALCANCFPLWPRSRLQFEQRPLRSSSNNDEAPCSHCQVRAFESSHAQRFLSRRHQTGQGSKSYTRTHVPRMCAGWQQRNSRHYPKLLPE